MKGAAWMLEPGDATCILTPERLSDELRLIAQTAREFVEKEVVPGIERLEKKDWAFARQLLQRAGTLGLIGVDAPEEYGGVGLDKAAALVVSSHTSGSASFSSTFGAQSNLALSAILYFGTDEQKARYLPKLISAELVGAYALSESGSGSDALSASCRAVRTSDGGFALTGEKMWITNGGFADVFIVFAKVDGEHFTAFIVERGFAGVSTGNEEHKMGLHGSSTTPLILQDVQVPASNLLGEVGKGHKVAFNVLNFGRFKLGAMCVGGAYGAIRDSARYAASRRQFGKPIAEFGAIKHKLAEMSVQTYAVESLLYRTAGLIDESIARNTTPGAVLAALEEFAVEASIAKVAGSETLQFVLDENVQIHGGNGFVSDYPAERHYRDSRVNRIFEGTNEINRLLIPGMLARRAVKGDVGVIAAARALQEELLGPPSAPATDDAVLSAETRAVEAYKKAALMAFGIALQTYGQKLSDEQEVLMHVADMLMEVYAADSAVLRAAAAVQEKSPKASLHVDAARVLVSDAALRIEASGRQALAVMVEGDTLRTMLAALRRLFKAIPVNTAVLRRRIVDQALERGGYPF